MNSILTVCIGNICRSPMAEALLGSALKDIHVSSAGIGALVGNRADPIAAELISERGLDISQHIARQINRNICQNADLILVMDIEQKHYIESTYSFARGKVFRIAESKGKNVPDPYKHDVSVFEESLSIISDGVDFWVDRIKKLNPKMQDER